MTIARISEISKGAARFDRGLSPQLRRASERSDFGISERVRVDTARNRRNGR